MQQNKRAIFFGIMLMVTAVISVAYASDDSRQHNHAPEFKRRHATNIETVCYEGQGWFRCIGNPTEEQKQANFDAYYKRLESSQHLVNAKLEREHEERLAEKEVEKLWLLQKASADNIFVSARGFGGQVGNTTSTSTNTNTNTSTSTSDSSCNNNSANNCS